MSVISNVSLPIIKSITQKIEIFDEMLNLNGYCIIFLFIQFIIDFHTLKAELTKQIMHAIQCEAYK